MHLCRIFKLLKSAFCSLWCAHYKLHLCVKPRVISEAINGGSGINVHSLELLLRKKTGQHLKCSFVCFKVLGSFRNYRAEKSTLKGSF